MLSRSLECKDAMRSMVRLRAFGGSGVTAFAFAALKRRLVGRRGLEPRTN